MRRRTIVAWVAQGALVLGLVLTVGTAAVVGVDDWSFMAVMAVLIGSGIGLWLRFAFALPLMMVDVAYVLVGGGLLSTPAPGEPTLLVRSVVGGLWVVGGMVGSIALAMATRMSGDPRDDIDTTAY